MMTSKERMWAALERRVPDRVPATVHQWQPYHLARYMGGRSDIEAFRFIGLDAAITTVPLIPRESGDWRVTCESLPRVNDYDEYLYTISTPEGTLSYRLGKNGQTSWVIEPMVKRPEDIELIRKYMPVPRLDKQKVREVYDELGDDGIVRGFVFGEQGGCWQDACVLAGTQEMIMAAFDMPDWVHRFMRILLDKKLQYIEESLAGSSYDLIETGGGAASSTVISPKMFKEFCLPYDREMHEAIHRVGKKVVYHTCGGMMPILELIVANGCDASETLSPPAVGGDVVPEQVKARIGSKVALIGGLDQFGVLTEGTPELIRETVFDLFAKLGPGGGYIMSPSDHFFDAPVENLMAYAQAARECKY
ncbi:MAG: hypothetical protein HPY71_09735 [Firmicutes bacterium]|nr:hypothetical protein [Bacillota bacterium]